MGDTERVGRGLKAGGLPGLLEAVLASGQAGRVLLIQGLGHVGMEGRRDLI